MESKRDVVTVDGLAGSGKTTLSRLLADKLGFVHFGSSLFYRAVAWLALQGGLSLSDDKSLVGLLAAHSIELSFRADGRATVLIDAVDRGDEVKVPEVSEATSIISAISAVRDALYLPQRDVFPGRPLVAEGRDMGTVIFPDAPVKFFISADVDVRVRRRVRELYPDKTLETLDSGLRRKLQIEIVERDERDANRAVAPTVAADDAIIVDNSSQMLTEVLENMYHAVTSRGLRPIRQ